MICRVNQILGQVRQLADSTKSDPEEILSAVERAMRSAWTRQHGLSEATESVRIDRSTGDVYVHFIDGSSQRIDLTEGERARAMAGAAKGALAGFTRRSRASTQLAAWQGREGTLVRGTVIDSTNKRTLVALDGATGIIPASRRVRGDFHREGEQVSFLLEKIDVSRQGEVELVGTRRGEKFVCAAVAEHVPEVHSGQVEITNAARVDGEETLLVVRSISSDISGPWSVRGPDNVRLRSIGQELPRRERLQVVAHSDDLVEFVRNALHPQRAKTVRCTDERCTIIGAEGRLDEPQLRRRLTLIGQLLDRDMHVEAESESEGARVRPSMTASEETVTHCQEWIRDGKRQCPNQHLTGSHYCALHAERHPGE
jgi:transcription antitermination factor NusA-like protein